MKPLPDTDLANIALSLATLLRSGMDLSYGSSMLPKFNGRAAGAVEAMKAKCADGLPLSEAMGPEWFPSYMTGLVRMGEQSGKLEQALYSLSDYYFKKHDRAVRVRSALTYPVILASLMLCVISVLLVKVLPVFDKVYASLGGTMTGAAGAMLAAGQALSRALPAVLAVVAVLAAACIITYAVPGARSAAVSLYYKIFGDRYVSKTANDSRFARAMSMGLASGMPLDEAVRLAAELNKDIPAAKARYDKCVQAIQEGEPVVDALASSQALPEDACELLRLGQASGTLDQLMSTIADRMSKQADDALERVSGAIEPALVILSSLAAGAVLVAVMLPLMDVMAAMQ